MKSFKQLTRHVEMVVESNVVNLVEDSALVLRNFITKEIDKLDNVDRLKEIYKAIAAPAIRKGARDLFKERGMSDSKGINAADQFAQRLEDSSIIPQVKMQLIDELRNGQAIDIRKLVQDSLNGLVKMKDSKYIIGKSQLLRDADFMNWFWTWEPPMGGRSVGGGEMLMILSEITGQKGGVSGGDVVWSDLAIEVKKAEGKGDTGGAGFGSSSKMSKALSVYLRFVNDTDKLPKKIKNSAKDLGFGSGKAAGAFSKTIKDATNQAQRFSATMNAITIPLSKAGRTADEINSMWGDVCKAAMGESVLNFNCTSSKGVTDVNGFMHTWVSNGISAYAAKEGHDILFLFDPGTLTSIAYRDGNNFMLNQEAGGGEISYDWVVSWDGLGYNNYVPRLKVKPYQNISMIKGLKAIDQLTDDLISANMFYKYFKKPLKSNGDPRLTADLINLGTVLNIANISVKLKSSLKLIVRKWKSLKKNITGNYDQSRIKEVDAGLTLFSSSIK